MQLLWRYLWPAPWTLAGLAAALAAWLLGARWQIRQGALEVHGGLPAALCRRLPGALRFDALTLGHVVLGVDAHGLALVRSHEQVHMRQYERWGVLFVPLYLASSLWQGLRGGHLYRDNHFERQACALAPAGCPLPDHPDAGNATTMVE